MTELMPPDEIEPYLKIASREEDAAWHSNGWYDATVLVWAADLRHLCTTAREAHRYRVQCGAFIKTIHETEIERDCLQARVAELEAENARLRDAINGAMSDIADGLPDEPFLRLQQALKGGER